MPLGEFQDKIVPLAEGGQLKITTSKGVAVEGRVKFLADVAWRRYCASYSNVHCDLSRKYAMLVFVFERPRCGVTVWGEKIADDKVIVREQASYTCSGGKPPPNEPLFPMSDTIYGPNDTPPLIILDGPRFGVGREDLQRVPVAVTAFSQQQTEKSPAPTPPSERR